MCLYVSKYCFGISGIVLTLYGNNTQSWSTIEMRGGGFVLAKNEAATRIQSRQRERNLLYSTSLKDQKMFVVSPMGQKFHQFVTGEQNCAGKEALTISSASHIVHTEHTTNIITCFLQNKHHHLINLPPFNTRPAPESGPCYSTWLCCHHVFCPRYEHVAQPYWGHRIWGFPLSGKR